MCLLALFHFLQQLKLLFGCTEFWNLTKIEKQVLKKSGNDLLFYSLYNFIIYFEEEGQWFITKVVTVSQFQITQSKRERNKDKMQKSKYDKKKDILNINWNRTSIKIHESDDTNKDDDHWLWYPTTRIPNSSVCLSVCLSRKRCHVFRCASIS